MRRLEHGGWAGREPRLEAPTIAASWFLGRTRRRSAGEALSGGRWGCRDEGATLIITSAAPLSGELSALQGGMGVPDIFEGGGGAPQPEAPEALGQVHPRHEAPPAGTVVGGLRAELIREKAENSPALLRGECCLVQKPRPQLRHTDD